MPIYMDIHLVPGIKAKDAAEAHRRDLLHQGEYDCKCITYWIDEERENIFCLVDAPNKEAVMELHGKAHGFVPNKIIEVKSSLVKSFLGRIYDPAEPEISDDGLKIFKDPSFRVLLVTRTTDPVLLKHRAGKEKANELFARLNNIVRKNTAEFNGMEAEHGGSGFIISFSSAVNALSCAMLIRREMAFKGMELIGLKMGINAGKPVGNSNKLFGDTIHLASCMCSIAGNLQIGITSDARELLSNDYFHNDENHLLILTPPEEKLLVSLYNKLEENWQNPYFNIPEYGHAMAMSTSQLYRKTIAITGLSANILLKEFRLEKAKELMKKGHHNISQISFESGFTSASYFTKCFKKKYGLLPLAYFRLLH